jgi:hypothetical protein
VLKIIIRTYFILILKTIHMLTVVFLSVVELLLMLLEFLMVGLFTRALPISKTDKSGVHVFGVELWI